MNDGAASLVNRLAGTNEEKHALLIALYNTTSFLFVGIGLAALFALYNMLYMFLAPMLWAVLVGTVLFPLKRVIAASTKGWLANLESSETPLALGLILLPFHLFCNLSDWLYVTATGEHGLHLLIAYVVLKLFTHEGTFVYLLSWLGKLYTIIDSFIASLLSAWLFPLIVVYTVGFIAWVVLNSDNINKKFARSLSVPIWVYILTVISSFFAVFRVFVFTGSSLLLILISARFIGFAEEEEKEKKNGDDDKKEEECIPSEISEGVVIVEKEVSAANDLLCGVCVVVALLWVVKHDWALFAVLVPLLFALLRQLGDAFGVVSGVSNGVLSMYQSVHPNLSKFINITVAGPVRELVKMIFSSDKMILSKLRAKMDLLSSVVVMLLLALGTFSACLFIVVQVHGETVHIARLTSSVMARKDWLGSALNYTEGRLEEQNIDIDDYIQQGYEQGRVWLANNVRSLASDKDSARADELEKQVMEVVDRLYEMWGDKREEKEEKEEKKDWMVQLRTASDLTALREELTHLVKDNVDTLIGVAQTVWTVIMLNVSLLSSLLLSFSSLLFSFGMEMLNSFIELIVFLTMVYYLLASSGDRWLPLHLLSKMSSLMPHGWTEGGEGFTSAIEDSIFGVFGLSCKMAVFYGLYTYFIHSLFDLNIVFVPSILASLFAAIPIMAPWTVCIVGMIELWLVRSEVAAAIVFAVCSLLPLGFADTKFYSEVKGMHPYLTGLAVIGGMYWLGIQGAIIGPLILCSFLVLLNVYANVSRT